MSRDILDENYYITSGGKIPVKWTAPEVCVFKILLKIETYIFRRQYTTGNIHYSVMFGVMVVYCMRYGVWGTNLLRICPMIKYVYKGILLVYYYMVANLRY